LNDCDCLIYQIPQKRAFYVPTVLLCAEKILFIYYNARECVWYKTSRIDISSLLPTLALHRVDNPFGSTINIVSSVTMQQNHRFPLPVHCCSSSKPIRSLLKWQSRLTPSPPLSPKHTNTMSCACILYAACSQQQQYSKYIIITLRLRGGMQSIVFRTYFIPLATMTTT